MRFRYIVYDRKKKKERSGFITADSIEDAQLQLTKKKSLTVRQVWPAAKEAVPDDDSFGLIFHSKKKKALVSRSEGGYRPSFGEFLERLRNYRLPNLVLVLLVLSGLALLPLSWGRDRQQHLEKDGFHKVEANLEAHLMVLDGELNPGDLQVTVRFPQIPYSLDFPGQDVVDESGKFSRKIQFASRELPGYCELTIRGEGIQTKTLPRVLLEGDEVKTARVPTISLSTR